MATEYIAEILHWDRPLHLLPSPGGIPEEHTFQGELLFGRGIELEGRVIAPPRHRGKRFRVWLSALWFLQDQEPIDYLGGVSERRAQSGGTELLVSLYAPQDALETAAVCLGATWKYVRVTTAGRLRGGARVVQFSFSRLRP